MDTHLAQLSTSLQVEKGAFQQVKRVSLLYIEADNDKERKIHFNNCKLVEFYSNVGPDVPIWSRSGDFTQTVPKGMSIRIHWGQFLLGDDLTE
ncbi:hypothetical protein V8C42DRAFT_336641 [Trichoderma barbatum]